MGNIVGKPFSVVASKNFGTALTESKQEGNQAKFYLTQAPSTNSNGGSLDSVITADNDNDRNSIVINGNVITGISINDIDKLNELDNVNGAFIYKGSVTTEAELKALKSLSPGDVWNCEAQVTLNNKTYPEGTNFVAKKSGKGDDTDIWDSLGGIIKLGTKATCSITKQTLSDLLHYSSDSKIISDFAMISTGAIKSTLNTDKNLILAVSCDNSISQSNRTLSVHLDASAPFETGYNGIKLSSGDGIKVKNKKVIINLATDDTFDGNNANNSPDSGLAFNTAGGLYINIASNPYTTDGYVPNLLKLGTSGADGGGGLYISSKVLREVIRDEINKALNVK